MTPFKIAISALFCFLPNLVNAWGMQGHRIVGEIASHYLTSKAKKEVKKILGDETIAMASNWADFIKSDDAFDSINSWHYIDLPAGSDRQAFDDILANKDSVNIYTKTNLLINELKAPGTSPERKRFCLKLIIHFVGDMHQPMHTGHVEDQGGNKLNVTWFGAPSNLHKVLDFQEIEFQNLSYTEYTNAIDHATKADRTAWQNAAISDWLFESWQFAGKLYDEIHPGDKLGYDFDYKYQAAINQRLLMGGIRLAGLLNQIFG
jgi:S1/P1 Nuclease